jgi:hypothetical protein
MNDTPRQDQNSVVAVFSQNFVPENAIKDLKDGGFDIKKLAVVGRHYQTEADVVGFYNTGDRMKYWGKCGAFWGGLWGLFFGAAFLIVPGIGPVVAAGSIVDWIIAALEGAIVVGGLSALGAGLYSLGIPKKQRRKIRDVDQSRQVRSCRTRDRPRGGESPRMLKTSGAEQIDSYEPSTEVVRVA